MRIRAATAADVPGLVALFAADGVGGHGDTTDAAALPDYLDAFARIEADPSSTLWVAEIDGNVAGTFQTTISTALSGRGKPVMAIEAVQVDARLRGRGIGAVMMRFAVERAREAGCRQVQLSSSIARKDAHRFYASLGFEQSHLAFKMKL